MKRLPENLLPNAEYWVGCGSLRVRTSSLMTAVQIAMDRCRSKGATVSIFDSHRNLIGQARADLLGRTTMKWSRPAAADALSALAILMGCMCALVLLMALARL